MLHCDVRCARFGASDCGPRTVGLRPCHCGDSDQHPLGRESADRRPGWDCFMLVESRATQKLVHFFGACRLSRHDLCGHTRLCCKDVTMSLVIEEWERKNLRQTACSSCSCLNIGWLFSLITPKIPKEKSALQRILERTCLRQLRKLPLWVRKLLQEQWHQNAAPGTSAWRAREVRGWFGGILFGTLSAARCQGDSSWVLIVLKSLHTKGPRDAQRWNSPSYDLLDTGDYPGHPVGGGGSLLAVWWGFGGFTWVPQFLCFCTEFPLRMGHDSTIDPNFFLHLNTQKEQIEAEVGQTQKERLALTGSNKIRSPKVLTWEKLELLDNIRCVGMCVGYL